MNVRIRNKNTGKTIYGRFPCEETHIQYLCDELQLPNLANMEVEVYHISDSEVADEILQGKTFKIDELNYLFKRLDSFDKNEMNTFYAVSYAEKMESAKEFINLTFNTNCYSVVTDFSDINKLGEKLYLNENGAASEEELRNVDGQQYIEEMIASYPNPLLSPYGFVYPNQNEPQDTYFGKTFPQYLNGFKVFDIAL